MDYLQSGVITPSLIQLTEEYSTGDNSAISEELTEAIEDLADSDAHQMARGGQIGTEMGGFE